MCHSRSNASLVMLAALATLALPLPRALAIWLPAAPIGVAVTADDEAEPAIAYDALDDRYLIVWAEGPAGDKDIKGRLISGAGVMDPCAGVTEIDISLGDPVNEEFPAVAFKESIGQFIVVWQHGDAATNIVGRSIGACGAVGGLVVLTAPDGVSEKYPDIAANPAGTPALADRFLIVYQKYGGATGIYGQFRTAGGAMCGAEFLIAPWCFEHPIDRPSCAYGEPGAADFFSVVRRQPIAPFNLERYKLTVTPACGPVLAGPLAIRTPLVDPGPHDVRPDVSYNPRCGQWLVAWGDVAGGEPAVLARRYDATFAAALGGFDVILPPADAFGITLLHGLALSSSQRCPSSVVTFAGSAAAAPSEVFARSIDCGGALGPIDMEPSSASPQLLPAIAYGRARGDYMIAWQRVPAGADIRARRYAGPACGGLLGDMNCDGVVDNGDIDHFVEALLDPAAYEASHPGCDILNGDVNGDGNVDNGDVDGFVELLT